MMNNLKLILISSSLSIALYGSDNPQKIALEHFERLAEKTRLFSSNIHHLPKHNNSIEAIAKDDAMKAKIAEHALATKIIFAKEAIPLFENFLKVKKEFGSEIEKNLYAPMTVPKYNDPYKLDT